MAKTAERKLEIAQRITELCCDEHGLDPEALIFDCLTFTLTTGDDEWRPERGRDDRGDPRDQGGDPRRQDLARRLQRVVRRRPARAQRAQQRVPAPLRRGRARPGDGQPQPHHAVRRDPRGGARARRRPRVQPPRGRARAVHRPLRVQGSVRRTRADKADPTEGMEPEEALHFHILRRKKEGVEDWIDAQRREDRRGPDAQRRAAAGDEGGRRQVRRRRADPPVRAAVGRGDEARGRPARAVPGQARGLHEGHGRGRHRVRRRPRHRQVARQHDPHQQRLHGRRPRQAGPDPDDPRRGRGAQGDRDRAVARCWSRPPSRCPPASRSSTRRAASCRC